MLIPVAINEGDYFVMTEVRALDIFEYFKSGNLKTINCGTIKPAAIMWAPGIIHDRILQLHGLCPTRYVADWTNYWNYGEKPRFEWTNHYGIGS